MTNRKPYGIQEPDALRQQRANVCYMETITPAQPSKEVRRQSCDYRVTAGFYWPAFAALVFIFIAALVALLHFDPIGKLAAHRYEVQNGID
jgi:hypothetical protein